ncbi:MAG TPA: glycosyltransferase [Hanamia sp.]|nr:glycosyltransferase [Hanamia sp.]
MERTKNILFISYDGMTDLLGQSQVIPYLTGLTKFGFQFTILSCEKPDRYAFNKDEIEKVLHPFPIKWAPIRYHKNPQVFSSIYDVYNLKKKAKQLHSSENFDLVHTRPGIPALVGLWMKNHFQIKFLNDVREFYADSRMDGEMWNQKIFFYRKIYHFFKRKENEAIEKSDGIVCLTYAAKKIILNTSAYKNGTPIDVIPCSVDMKLFDPEKVDIPSKLRLKAELNIHENDFIFSYLGSVGSWYLLDELMDFFKIMNDKIPNAKFLFISPDNHEIIMSEAKRAALDQTKILIKKAKRTEVPALLSLVNFSAFFIKPCYSKQSSSPTKHAEIMAMGIPVITNSGVGDVADIVEKYKSGLVIENFDKQNFESAADAIAAETYFDKNSIRRAAFEYYDLDEAVEKYRKIYQEIIP